MKRLIAIAMLIAMCTNARADAPLAYQTIQPSKIVMGESAILRITSLDSELQNAKVPEVAGLSFEVLGHSRSMEFINGTASESSSLIVRVTPQLAGIFSIPGLTPKSQPLILEVDADRNSGNLPLTLDGKAPRPPPPPAPKTANAAGIHFVADGSAFVQLKMPKRGVYVGESVPVDIIVGVRPGLVTALNGLPTIKGGDFTLNNLSRQPVRQEEILDGKPFLTMTWHSVLAAVKAGAVDYLSKPADADDVARALLAASGQAPPPPENPMSADRVRWEHIQRVYELCGHNISETARRLNMHRRTLQRILAKRAPR